MKGRIHDAPTDRGGGQHKKVSRQVSVSGIITTFYQGKFFLGRHVFGMPLWLSAWCLSSKMCLITEGEHK